jgi:peptidoglycan hydrolase-like protein with peptidoglycan-binding domain
MSLKVIDTYLVPNGDLTLKSGNRPLFIIMYTSGTKHRTIYDVDAEDKYTHGKVMFGGHFFIAKDGTIFKGRPLNTFGDFASDGKRNFNINSIGICLEGDYELELMPTSQKNAIVLLIQQLRYDHSSIRSIYALDELFRDTKNPGTLFPMNEILSQALNVGLEPLRIAPNGLMRYAFKTRTLYYDAKKPITGNDVKELQIILNLFKFPCDVTEVFDAITLDAVISFQKSNNLTPDGIVGEETFAIIKKMSEKFYENRLNFNRILYVIAPNYLYGNDVKRLQERLNLLGYPCTVDGFYDEDTSEAVRSFQEIHSLIPDGKVGPVTWSQITTANFDFIKRLLVYTTPMLYGDDVKLVQQRLSDLGFPVAFASGWYDEITRQQVINFQKTRGLKATGEVDQATTKELFK